MFILRSLKGKTINAIVKVFTGDAIAQGLNFLTLAIIARYYGPSEISLFTVSLALLTLLLAIADSGIANSIVNLANKSDKLRRSYYLSVGFYIRLIFGMMILAFGFVFSQQIANTLYGDIKLNNMFLYAFVGVIMLSIHGYIVMVFQANEEFNNRAIFQVFTALLRIVVISTFLLFIENISIDYIFLTYICAPSLVVFFYYKEIQKIIEVKLNYQIFKRYFILIISYSKWLFFSMLAVLIIMRVDQFMLLKLSTPTETSYYAIALQLAMIMPLFTDSITTVLLPKISNIQNSIGEYRIKILTRLLPLSLFFLLLVLPAKFIIVTIFGPDFVNAVPVFQVLVVGFCISIIVNPLSLIFYSISKVWYLTILNYLQLILIILLNIIYIPAYGALGATIGTICVRFIALIYVLYFTKRVINEREVKSVVKKIG